MAEGTGKTTGTKTTEDLGIISEETRAKARELANQSKKPEGEIAFYTDQPTPDTQLGKMGTVEEPERAIVYDGASARTAFLREHGLRINSTWRNVHTRYGRDLNGGSLSIYGNPTTGEVTVETQGSPASPENAEKARLFVETSLSDATFPLVRNPDTDLVEIRHYTPIGR